MPEVLHREVILDSEAGIDRGDWSLAAGDVPGSGGDWSVTQTELYGGKQEGSKVLSIRSGAMQLDLIPTRGMGILRAQAGDVRLGWDSPIKEVVHPRFMNLESRGGLGWLEGFNEWMCRCGLEFSGHPGVDEFTNNTGDKDSMMLTLHGKIANIPCSYAEVRVERDADTVRIVVRSRVSERVFHGPKLELWSEIAVEVGATRFSIRDAVTNHGALPQETQLLYHCNFGSPLLEKDARFVGAVETNDPFNARAAEGLQTYDRYEAPTDGFVEQVYKMKLKADERGDTRVMLRDAAGSRGASMRFNVSELPYFTLWKYTAAASDGYVTGLEPGTCFPHNRKRERAEGRVKTLAPGATDTFGLDVELHLTPDSVKEAEADIRAIGA